MEDIFFGNDMSAERLSFAFNSLIPETYKSKAEAFAKCLQHKLLSLGRIDTPPEPLNGDPRRTPNTHEDVHTKPELPQKTEDSEEELHSESDNGESTRGKQKLTSMSSEDSTVESWGSCQENLTDLEKLDSEAEEVSSLAAQVRGSPKLRSLNIRTKRKELRERTWKKNGPRRNHSSSTESVDSEGIRQSHNRQPDDFELSSQFILLDGLEPEDDVPHRILRESSSTSSLERHFSHREDCFKPEKRDSQPLRVDADLLTPPPSPDLQKQRVSPPIQFAEIVTDSGGCFFEVESLVEPSIEELSRPVRKLGDVVLECGDDVRIAESPCGSVVVTCVEVLQDGDSPPPSRENTPIEAPEDDDLLNSRSQMRRCSSLKTCKTPPGTPGSKKIVRFADALGLDLADVRTFLDEIPRVPSSAYKDLHFDIPCSDLPPTLPLLPTLLPLFLQPSIQPDFLEKVHTQKICLESTVVTLEGVPAVTGFVRVRNLGFQKSVHVRYTLNNWETFSDLQATYVPNSCDGFSDRFSFVLYGHTLKVGEKLEFALRLDCCGGQYWDNNGGMNYVFHCLPQTSGSGFLPSLSSSTGVDPWFDFY